MISLCPYFKSSLRISLNFSIENLGDLIWIRLGACTRSSSFFRLTDIFLRWVSSSSTIMYNLWIVMQFWSLSNQAHSKSKKESSISKNENNHSGQTLQRRPISEVKLNIGNQLWLVLSDQSECNIVSSESFLSLLTAISTFLTDAAISTWCYDLAFSISFDIWLNSSKLRTHHEGEMLIKLKKGLKSCRVWLVMVNYIDHLIIMWYA